MKIQSSSSLVDLAGQTIYLVRQHAVERHGKVVWTQASTVSPVQIAADADDPTIRALIEADEQDVGLSAWFSTSAEAERHRVLIALYGEFDDAGGVCAPAPIIAAELAAPRPAIRDPNTRLEEDNLTRRMWRAGNALWQSLNPPGSSFA